MMKRTRPYAQPRPRRHTVPEPAPARGHIPSRAQRRPSARRSSRKRGVLVLLILLGLALGLIVRTCTANDRGASATVRSYDWSHLVWSGERLAYVEDRQTVSRLGVDVSDHQGLIDWASVAADGIDFAMVRLGYRGYSEGALNVDSRASYNLDGAASAGLDVGAYFFSQAISVDEAREEAEFVLEILDGRALDMPIAFDHEPVEGVAGRANALDSETLTACANVFCETLEAAGYATMVYGNQHDLERLAEGGNSAQGSATDAEALADAVGGRAIWFAAYDVAQPTTAYAFTMWQYTNAGSVAGIETSVDLNILLPAS